MGYQQSASSTRWINIWQSDQGSNATSFPWLWTHNLWTNPKLTSRKLKLTIRHHKFNNQLHRTSIINCLWINWTNSEKTATTHLPSTAPSSQAAPPTRCAPPPGPARWAPGWRPGWTARWSPSNPWRPRWSSSNKRRRQRRTKWWVVKGVDRSW